MATGITKLHSRLCRSRNGGRCNCGAGYEAWVYLSRDRKKVRKTFAREAEARSWRADALAAANRGTLRPMRRDTRTIAEALADFIDGMGTGAVRPKGREGYKPATVRSYEQQFRAHIKPSGLAGMKVRDSDQSPTSLRKRQDESEGRIVFVPPTTVS